MLRWATAGVFFLVTVAFWPWWEGAGLTPRWCVLLAGVPLLLQACRALRPTPAHWLGAALLAYAALSLAWTPVWQQGVAEWVKLALIGGCFAVGAELDDPRPAYWALALGVGLNGALALAQVFGFALVPQLAPPAGLFVNRNYLAEIGTGALVLTLGVPRLRWLVPPVACAALLPHSRGALLALGLAGICWLWARSRVAAGLAATAAALVLALLLAGSPAARAVLLDKADDVHVAGNALETRIEVWTTTLQHLTLMGHGAGSFMTAYPLWTPHQLLSQSRPAQAHNEVIHEAAELGLPGLVLIFGFFAYCLGGRRGQPTERLALVALLALGLWSFPLHLPATGALVGVLAGRLARARAPLCLGLPHRRAAPRFGV